MVNTGAPQNPNTVIANGIFLIQSTPRCLSYNIFVQKIVSSVLELTQDKADLCFDVYQSPSIKDTKRKERGNEKSDRVFSIGPKTKKETDMHDLLRLSCFKRELLRFFFKETEDQIYAPITGTKLLYIAIDNKYNFFFVLMENFVGKVQMNYMDTIQRLIHASLFMLTMLTLMIMILKKLRCGLMIQILQ